LQLLSALEHVWHPIPFTFLEIQTIKSLQDTANLVATSPVATTEVDFRQLGTCSESTPLFLHLEWKGLKCISFHIELLYVACPLPISLFSTEY